ncbi:unnamed protein product [Clonostachys rosea f. rosea IK726]|uniref:Uncharacterized protein n=1 Tax=Clonostachys rosea f. rosea IK726 TaxID=1349383 RepID=A0ACA9UTL3_BIOOC|nr:unnamed protein product [Clonostachys rosea f. rosea IK726]
MAEARTLYHLNVNAILWLGLASYGLAQSLDEPDNLAIRGENVEEIIARDIDLSLKERDDDDGLETRDNEDELVDVRDFEDDLAVREFEEALLEARGLYARQASLRPRPRPRPAPAPNPAPPSSGRRTR